MQQARKVKKGARITLTKRIPLAAGLGGGSSDAAVTLRALDKLWGLDLSEAELLNAAGLLGSDVPFFLRGGTALVEGRGDEISVRPLAPCGIVLITRAGGARQDPHALCVPARCMSTPMAC